MAVRTAVEHVFTQWAAHKFPPAIEIPGEWRPELEASAKELGYPATTAAEIKSQLRDCIERIANS